MSKNDYFHALIIFTNELYCRLNSADGNNSMENIPSLFVKKLNNNKKKHRSNKLLLKICRETISYQIQNTIGIILF